MAGKKTTKDSKDIGGKGGKGKAKGKEVLEPIDANKLKDAHTITVRHILVSVYQTLARPDWNVCQELIMPQCEKYSKKEEAMAKLKSGESWASVANEYAVEKAKSGEDFMKPT